MSFIVIIEIDFFPFHGWIIPEAGRVEFFQPEWSFCKIKHDAIYSEAVDMNNPTVLSENLSVLF